jgi:hypothetical protein
MSVADEPEMLGLHDPTHDPPRRRREKPERQPMPDDGRALRGKTHETAGRRTSPLRPPPRSRLVRQSQRRQPDLNAKSRLRAVVRELEQCGMSFASAGRLAAAIGVSAIIALFLVNVMPEAQQPDGGQSLSAAVEPFNTAQSQRHQREDASGPAVAGFQSLLENSAQAARREQTDRQQSGRLLQEFMHWRQTANPSEAAR